MGALKWVVYGSCLGMYRDQPFMMKGERTVIYLFFQRGLRFSTCLGFGLLKLLRDHTLDRQGLQSSGGGGGWRKKRKLE